MHTNILFGIFLCGKCVKYHQSHFPYCQEFIKNLEDKNWKDFQIEILSNGGNCKFNKFLTENYDIDTTEIEYNKKYINNAAKYYMRNLLFNENKDLDENKPDKKEGREQIKFEELKNILNDFKQKSESFKETQPKKLLEVDQNMINAVNKAKYESWNIINKFTEQKNKE